MNKKNSITVINLNQIKTEKYKPHLKGVIYIIACYFTYKEC